MSRAMKNILARADTFGRPSRAGPDGAATKAIIAADSPRMGVQGRPRYPDTSPDALGRTLRRNELVYACVRAKGNALAKPQLVVEKRTGTDTYEPIAGHPLRRLLIRPNDHMDMAAFFRAFIVSRDIYGRFFAEKLLSPAGAVIGLNPLDPRKLRHVAGANDQGHQVVTGWEWRDGSTRVLFAPEELLIWEPLGWVEPPAAEVALGSVDSDDAQTDYVRAFFNNAGVPSGILTVKKRLDQEKVDHLKARWRAAYSRGSGTQHDLAVLDEEAAYQKVGSALDELESETVRGVSESRICMAFGVPPLIVYAYTGLLRATYSNLKEAYAGFWDLTIDPLLGDILSWLTMTLLEAFEGRERVLSEAVRLRWDTSEVAALQEDEDAKHARARENLKAGGILLNEFREIVGLDRDPQGDYYLRGIAVQPVAWLEEGETPAGASPSGQGGASVDRAPADAEPLLTLDGDPATATEDVPAKARKLRRLATMALKAASTDPIAAALERELVAYLRDEYQRAAAAIREEA